MSREPPGPTVNSQACKSPPPETSTTALAASLTSAPSSRSSRDGGARTGNCPAGTTLGLMSTIQSVALRTRPSGSSAPCGSATEVRLPGARLSVSVARSSMRPPGSSMRPACTMSRASTRSRPAAASSGAGDAAPAASKRRLRPGARSCTSAIVPVVTRPARSVRSPTLSSVAECSISPEAVPVGSSRGRVTPASRNSSLAVSLACAWPCSRRLPASSSSLASTSSVPLPGPSRPAEPTRLVVS